MIGTHAVLLREPQSNAAKVFLFGEAGSGQKMRAWRFFASDSLRLPSTSFVDSTSVLVVVPHPDTLANDLFCNGHSTLPDGRMIFIGGNYQPRNACETVYTFDPAWLGGGSSPWTVDATMAVERWYATATALPDGRILGAAGEARTWLGAFGGRTDSGVSDRVWRPLAFAAHYNWGDTTAVPADATPPASPTRVRGNGWTAGQYPPGREDHAFADIPSANGLVFGGRQVFAGGADTTLGDLWHVQPTRLANDSVMTWTLLHQVDDDLSQGPPEVVPCPRTRAAFVWAGINWGDTTTCLPLARDSLTCFLFGGRDSMGNALGDLWIGRLDSLVYRYVPGTGLGIGMVQDWRWTQLLADAPERRRFGHTMWFDPGQGGPGAPYARLVIFGGQIGDSTLASNKVYTYGVGSHPAVNAVWDSIVPAAGSSYWGVPQARQGHMATLKRPLEPGATRKFYLTGGQDARGNLLPAEAGHGETNDTHVWALTRDDTTAASPAYVWDWVAWSSSDSGGPNSRARAGLGYDPWSERLVMVGGDLNGDGQSGGLTDSVWCIQVEIYGGGVLNRWFQPMQRSPVDTVTRPPMPPTAGLSLLSYGGAGYVSESSMEVYSTNGTSSACTPWSSPQATWTTITTQDSLSQREISAYPYLFVLPDGRLFNAGPPPDDNFKDKPYRRFYSFTTNQWSDDAGAHLNDAYVPGSAVMYRPGKVLRAGSHGPKDVGTASGRTETIEIGSGAMPAWVEYGGPGKHPLTDRLNHNLTLLPGGDVLATGGVSAHWNDDGFPVRRPQLWRVATGSWNNNDSLTATTRLEGDPRTRNYHSMAMLLPDGRVMTAGGEKPVEDDRFTVSVYEPPYLFSGDGYARRPVVSGLPEVLRYGEPFTLTVGTLDDTTDVDSIRSVALVRPAAVTHGFDQNQRYVPLDFVPRTNPRRLLAWAPADSFLAPPGEYMLFVTRGRGNSADSLPVPSLARWVVVQRPQGTQRDSLDVIAPRGSSYLDLERTNPCEPNSEVALQWKAPADDDTLAFSGRATGYDLRWIENYQAPHFNLWNAHGTPSPQAVFATETATVTQLQDGVWYRFAVRAVGNNADSSALSNVLVAKAMLCEEGSSGGSGGGGEEYGIQRGGAGSFAVHAEAAAASAENTLLPGVPTGTRGRDLLKLAGGPGGQGSARRAFVRQGHGRGLLVANARLLAVDHAEGSEVLVTPEGGLRSGVRLAASAVAGRDGRDVTAAATGLETEPVYADSGEVLEVTLPAQPEQRARTAVFELMGGGSSAPGVEVEYRTGEATWQALTVLHPRREWDAAALEVPATDRLRLAFRGAYALRFAGELGGAVPVSAQAATMTGATSAYAGEAFDESRAAVDTSLAMVAGDTLSLLFADLPPAEAGARTWLLEVEGTPVAPREAQALARQRDPAPQVTVPVAFAMYPAAPNPTRGTVRLAFDLPQRASVRLEVFDAQGRRVRRLEGVREPGRHAFEWDLRHAGGTRVAPGIYTYRLTAGRFRAQSKVAVLP